MIKRLLFIVITALVAVCLVACGQVVDDTTKPDDSNFENKDTEHTVSADIETEPPLSGDEHTHSYSENVLQPTCTSIGCKAMQCTCGDIQSIIEYIPMTEHKGNAASCGVDSVCSVCGEVLVKAYDHIFVYSTVEALTCTTDGVEKVTCQRCGISEDIITKASHSYQIYTIEDGKMSTTCERCGRVVSDVKFTDLHNEDTSGVSIDKISMSNIKYNLPNEVVGINKAPYQIDFTFTLDSITNPANIVNSQNGRNVFQYIMSGQNNSLIRAFPVSDGSGGYRSDVIEIGSLEAAGTKTVRYLQMKAGDSVRISLVVTPNDESVDIYVNGKYASTREADTYGMMRTSTQVLFGYSGNNSFKGTVSNFAIFRVIEGEN